MILQTIKLPFDAGTADTIYTKQGETGRGIWFDLPFLIGEEEIPDYKAEFIAVKPDDTFVIEDATITNHGDGEDLHSVCYLTLPEQVSAAKGTGSYIVKVYDYAHDNDLIYSASGGLYVDDHLLLDSMIESIAEVNGYNFPDDFLTRDDLESIIDDTVIAVETTWSSHKIDEEITDAATALQNEIDNIIDDNTTSADSTWSSQKISDSLAPALEFSTTEHVVGKWINGKPIYEKTIFFPLTAGARTTYNWPAIPDIEGIVMWSGGIVGDSDPDVIPQTIWGQGAFNDYSWGASVSLVFIGGMEYQVGTAWGSNIKGMIHLFYTKTTD